MRRGDRHGHYFQTMRPSTLANMPLGLGLNLGLRSRRLFGITVPSIYGHPGGCGCFGGRGEKKGQPLDCPALAIERVCENEWRSELPSILRRRVRAVRTSTNYPPEPMADQEEAPWLVVIIQAASRRASPSASL